jgi:murein DD-endopeptidase MepM/ murein hydrolase activator NlpD
VRYILLLLLLVAVATAEPNLSVKGSTYEGSALFVRLTDCPDQSPPTAVLEEKTYEFVPATDGVWELVLPLSTESGGQVSLSVSSEEKSWQRSFQVKTRNYGHQSISLNPTTLASYDDPQNKADDKEILEVLEADHTERLFRQDFVYPVQAPQTTGFGLRRTYNGWRKGWHKGLDLAGWEGEAVKAPSDAVVLHTARGVVNGNTVVLSHGAGVGSVYMHLNSIQVSTGQRLKRGQALGTVGGTGGFAPHLHWETRVHGVPVNPKLFFAVPKGW